MEQDGILLEGSQLVSGSACRLSVLEEVYRSRTYIRALEPTVARDLEQRFEDSVVDAYVNLLEFYSRAICYITKHKAIRLLKSIPGSNEWRTLLKTIEASEIQCMSYKELIDSEKLHSGIEEQQRELQKIFDHLMGERNARASSDSNEFHRSLRKLHTCPYENRKNRNRQRVPGTCEWFVDHPVFKNWIDSADSSLLIVSADPGCGKSVLAKYLVDEIIRSRDDRTVCYFFFKDDFEDQNHLNDALCAVIRQMLLQNPQCYDLNLARKFETDANYFLKSRESLFDEFRSMVTRENFGEIVVILDALDECDLTDLSYLGKELSDLFKEARLASKVKFLVTSRPYEHILRGFKSQNYRSIIRLSGENEVEVEKIVKEIDLVIQDRVNEIGLERDLQPEEVTFLLDQLKAIPHRTYIWVMLTMDVIQNLAGFTKGNVKKSIGTLPTTVDEAYEKILNRSKDPEKTRKLLKIVVGARRPLTVTEISLPLAIEQGHTSADEIEEEPPDRFRRTLRDLCGLFITIVNSKIYLLHQTAKEFLMGEDQDYKGNASHRKGTELSWKNSVSSSASGRTLAEQCVRCLCLFPSSSRYSTPMFVAYAEQNWHFHLRDSDVGIEDGITYLSLSFCMPSSDFCESEDLLEGLFMRKGEWSGCEDSAVAVCVASALGVEVLVHRLLEDGASAAASSTKGWTALHAASERGFGKIIDLLLLYGANIESVDNLGNTPLIVAITRAPAVALQLLSKGANPNAQTIEGLTPLIASTRYEDALIATQLLAARAYPNTKEHRGYHTALHKAVLDQTLRVVTTLLAHGAEVDAEDLTGATPLCLAMMYTNLSIVKELIASGAQVNHQDHNGWTPLFHAVSRGQRKCAELLIERGTQINHQDHKGWTPLLHAINYRAGDCARFLVNNHVDVRIEGKNGLSPLALAKKKELHSLARLIESKNDGHVVDMKNAIQHH